MPMGPMGMGPIPGYPMAMGPMGMMGPSMNSINAMGPPGGVDLIARRKEFLKDKDNTNKDPTTVKKVAIGYVIYDLEALGVKDSRKLAGKTL